jgi:PPOX class probable F420-dependent enzyme
VLITRRSGGGLQTSPVLVGVDGEGKVVISTREGADKTRNLRRDPTVVLCILSDDFFGRWIQIEGTAQVISLPEAMEGLVDYYRRISGEHPDWEDYRRPCGTSSACWFASRSTRRVRPTPASHSRPSRRRLDRRWLAGALAGDASTCSRQVGPMRSSHR